MDNEVVKTLGAFASHTRMNDAECRNVNFVGQRYLASHLNIVEPKQAFSMLVGNDYDALTLRTHKPPLSRYSKEARVSVPTFIALVQNGYPQGVHMEWASKEAPSYVSFCNAVFPATQNEELWKRQARLRHWRPVAYYLAANYANIAPTFEQLMNGIHGAKGDYAALCSLIDRVAAYGRHERYGGAIKGAHDVGSIIGQMNVPQEHWVDLKAETVEKDKEQPMATKATNKQIIVLKDNVQKEENQNELEMLRADMEPYRRRAGLPATVPTERIAKQMLLAAIDQHDVENAKPVLGRFQQKITPIQNKDEQALVCRIIDALPTMPVFDPNKSVRCKAISSALLQNEWDPKSLLKHIVMPDQHMDARALHRYETTIAADNANNKSESELVRAIVAE